VVRRRDVWQLIALNEESRLFHHWVEKRVQLVEVHVRAKVESIVNVKVTLLGLIRLFHHQWVLELCVSEEPVYGFHGNVRDELVLYHRGRGVRRRDWMFFHDVRHPQSTMIHRVQSFLRGRGDFLGDDVKLG